LESGLVWHRHRDDVLDRAVELQGAWARIDEQLTTGNVNISALVMEITSFT
jgi:hypothetical protein